MNKFANRFALVAALLLGGCAVDAQQESEADPLTEAPAAWSECVGDNPCSANVYCDADAVREDSRCWDRAGECLRFDAAPGLACFPAADGSMRAGKCSAAATCEAP